MTAHELIGRLQSQQALGARHSDSASSPEVAQALQQLAKRIGALVASLHRQSTVIVPCVCRSRDWCSAMRAA